MENPYTSEYYHALRDGARKSAEAIVPRVLGLLHPGSVVDVGCGDGTWLSVFRKEGVQDILGVDREYVSGKILEIPEGNFLAHDLRAPLATERVFDLVVSLEVAEHLPAEHAETFVDSLGRLGPVVLFSAAVPFQGGTDHVNEQWPEYWADLFDRKGFVALDPIRKHIWARSDVEYWYRQNILLFVKKEYLENRPELEAEGKVARGSLSIIHPEMFLAMERRHSEALRDLEVSMANAQALRGETAVLRGEAAALREAAAGHRAKAEHYIAEADRYREEAETLRGEAAALRKEAAGHRAKAEHCIAEADRYREEAETSRGEAAALRAEADRCLAEAREFRAKAQPENMSLKEVISALPGILAGAFRRLVHHGRITKSGRSDDE